MICIFLSQTRLVLTITIISTTTTVTIVSITSLIGVSARLAGNEVHAYILISIHDCITQLLVDVAALIQADGAGN